MPRVRSGAAIDRPKKTNLILPPLPEVVWQQPQEAHVTNIYETWTTETHKNTQMPKIRQRIDVESKTSPMKETSPQVSGSSPKQILENQTGSTPVQSLNDSNASQCEIQRHAMTMTANDNGDNNNSPPKITNSQIEEQLVRDDFTIEIYMPLPSTIILKRKKEMLYVSLIFENG